MPAHHPPLSTGSLTWADTPRAQQKAPGPPARKHVPEPLDKPPLTLVSAETRIEELSREDEANGISFSSGEPPESRMESARDLADALVQLCADYLSAKAATAENPDTYQVIIHAGAAALPEHLADLTIFTLARLAGNHQSEREVGQEPLGPFRLPPKWIPTAE